MKQSAGILLYRPGVNELEVLLVHPSGNYNRKSPYSIPKGLPDPEESLEDAARRETWEETGIRFEGPLEALGSIQYRKSKKIVHVFAGPAPVGMEPKCASWEVDVAKFVPLSEAREILHPDQVEFLDRLHKKN